ncbi:MAG: T9SS type A sorting domain-containing protein [Owenweeksia sp.]|nr:T9SS type A sorting domain-containing protein [Owenweeksia sp.]
MDNLQPFNSGSRAAYIFDETGTPTIGLKEFKDWPVDISVDHKAGAFKIWGADGDVLKAGRVFLYNLSGQLIYQREVKNQRILAVPALPSGIYLVQLEQIDGHNLITKKVSF